MGGLRVVAGLLALAGCAGAVDRGANPAAAPETGLVVLFAGLSISGEGVRGTGTQALGQSIRRAGVPALIEASGDWEEAARTVLARPEIGRTPVSVYGYSWGARSAGAFAERLEAAGVPVQRLVALESHFDVAVPCNVGSAVQYRVDTGGDRLFPARPGCVPVVNRLFPAEDGFTMNHYSASQDGVAQAVLLRELLDGNRVRRGAVE